MLRAQDVGNGPPTTPQSRKIRVVIWGTYDLGKPRTRILIRGLREAGVDITECHRDIWSGVEDKAGLTGWRQIASSAFRLLAAYPVLIWRYLRLPRHDAVIVGYLGHLDILVLWLFARLRGVPLLWDAFLSLHETVVEDRAMLRASHPFARLLWAWDWLACRAADVVLLDTRAHADWFAKTFNAKRTAAVFVGAEADAFAPLPEAAAGDPGRPVQVLFYGQFIALHGIQTIIEAAARTRPEDFAWTLIGKGQEAPRIRRRLEDRPIPNLEWIDWVPYEQLRQRMSAADICLGIFGQSGKAGRVIPNKVFQIISAGRPLVTRDSSAIRELIGDDDPHVRLVAAGDPAALLTAVTDLARRSRGQHRPGASDSMRERIGPAAIGQQLKSLLSSLIVREGHP